MKKYTKEELLVAQKAIASSIHKIEKAKESLSKKQPPPKPQLTLATRNLAALRISTSLIMRELQEYEQEGNS